jgi:ribosomal protein S18 acetylase RimI-like enzyme
MENTDKPNITKAQKSDAGEILRLQRAAYQSEAEIYKDDSIQPLTQTLEDTLAEFDNGIVLKAVADDKIIGSVRAHEKDGTVFIGKLMVLPDSQNQGLGRKLLQAIEKEFQDRRYELFTGDKSIRNIALYKKCGYAVFKKEEVAPGLVMVYMEKQDFRVEEITPDDYPLLENFLYHAIFVPQGIEPPPYELIYDPEIFVYVDGFGTKPGDYGVVAWVQGKAVGAAWTRIIPAYGHIDDKTPELAISLLPEYRGCGIGTAMMERLFGLLKKHGHKQTSLNVQKDNPAVRFYERLGYKTVSERVDHAGNEDYTMIKDLESHYEGSAK